MDRHTRGGDGPARRVAVLPSAGRTGAPDRGARIRRNVRVDGRRTSVSLEMAVWEALFDICRAEGLSLDALSTDVGRSRSAASLASGLRIFALTYFRTAQEEAPAETRGGGTAPDRASRYRRVLERFRRSRRRSDGG